ncbi:hypothetical protein CTI12_AA506450 [Artemisia annua]|uniref:Uncharacterized protein n=1 Tax=Artemisia annua TaxID=35608 RepID=A0A2U1KRI1_ARTAN|nr:hypothetical protein CTI12_AA506450 [Artemisia annua]
MMTTNNDSNGNGVNMSNSANDPLYIGNSDHPGMVLTNTPFNGKIEGRSKLIQFLMKLNDEYESVRNQILAMDPLPTVNKAYYIVQQIEKQKQGVLV